MRIAYTVCDLWWPCCAESYLHSLRRSVQNETQKVVVGLFSLSFFYFLVVIVVVTISSRKGKLSNIAQVFLNEENLSTPNKYHPGLFQPS